MPQPKGQLPPMPQGGAVTHSLAQSQLHMKVPPSTSQTQASYSVGLDLSTGGCNRGAAHPKPILPPCSPSQLPHRPSTPLLALPPHLFPSTHQPTSHHHPGMFTPSPGLPPPPPLLQVAGHPAAVAAISGTTNLTLTVKGMTGALAIGSSTQQLRYHSFYSEGRLSAAIIMPTLLLLQKDATLKTPEQLELRLKHSGKRKRGEGNNSEPEDEDEGSEKDRSQCCGGERGLRKRSKRRHKEPSLQSYLETGYICDTESDPEEQASIDDLEQSFTVSTSKALGPIGALNGSCETKLSVIPKVSGLERSQERNYEADRDCLLVPFLTKEPPSQAATAPILAQALPPNPPAPPPVKTLAQTPNTVRGMPQPKGQLPPMPQGGAVTHSLAQSQLHMKVPPSTSQTQASYSVGLDLSTGG
ncbi:autism susceptibility gene 2 protein-like [Pseudonaja textilis]|uniref:autism susceptibility gene 2 protein-like n=1 Tax=Pseudonaja textilis TaxID=8673 RepID=UPI000EA94159|nr:autism susceptibility gene 2 protein-like [Pseudonaja textilis]